jgi:hypothetical protein
MPTYDMRNKQTGEVERKTLTLSEREELLATGEWEQELSTPGFVTMPGGTLSRTSGDWKDLLKNMKRTTGKGNTIKV